MRILTLRTIGNFLLYFTVFTIARTFAEPVRNEIRYFTDQIIEKRYVVAEIVTPTPGFSARVLPATPTATPTPTPNALAELIGASPIEVLQPVNTEFSLVVPRIAANVKVIKDVDTTNQESYTAALKNGVAHAMGTAYPGQGGHVYLFAHSTDYWWNVGQYNAVFYLLYKLLPGDEVDIFYEGNRYVYRVIGQQVVDPSQVEYLTRRSDKEFLTLQTCWPPGTTLKRLLVFAVPASQYRNGVIQ